MRVVKVIPKDSTELSDILVEEDSFYGCIFIAPKHLDAWQKEFNAEQKAEDSLIEEMAELIQAINKQRRSNTKKNKDAIVEEMAHVLISMKGLCRYKMITPGEIEKEIQKKWPAAYESQNELVEENKRLKAENKRLEEKVDNMKLMISDLETKFVLKGGE